MEKSCVLNCYVALSKSGANSGAYPTYTHILVIYRGPVFDVEMQTLKDIAPLVLRLNLPCPVLTLYVSPLFMFDHCCFVSER